MNSVRHAPAHTGAAATGLASWYVPAWPDGFGDRLLMFDNTSTPSLELLRFRPEIAAVPGFEEALRERVRRLDPFRHGAFSQVRAVQHLDEQHSLALVSVHTPGQRLSELFTQRPRAGLNPAIVTWVLRELTPALAALQAQAPGVAHSALSADRIVLTGDGRLCIVEHVLGAALGTLARTPTELWRDFALCAPSDPNGIATLDTGTDMVQLAGIALSMLVARPVSYDDLRQRLPELLDEVSERGEAQSPHHVPPLRLWLERALHVGGDGYRSASDAQYDVRQLPAQSRAAAVTVPSRPAAPAAPLEQPAAPSAPVPAPSASRVTRDEPSRPTTATHARGETIPLPVQTSLPGDSIESFPSEVVVTARVERRPSAAPPLASRRVADAATVAPRPAEPRPAAPAPRPAGSVRAPVPVTMVAESPAIAPSAFPATGIPPQPADRGRPFLVVAMAAAIIMQSALIAFLAGRPAPAAGTTAGFLIESAQPGDTVIVNGEAAGVTPLQVPAGTDLKSVRVIPATLSSAASGTASGGASPTPTVRSRGGEATAAAATAPARSRSGSIRVVSPIELRVLEGSDVLGSTGDGPLTLSPGTHQLELVNTALGYRARQAVTIKAGQTTSVSVTPPDGLVSINAQPWANVQIGDKQVGETPLAHLKVPIGEHEVIFTHPELGELRRRILVRATDVTRVAVTFER